MKRRDLLRLTGVAAAAAARWAAPVSVCAAAEPVPSDHTVRLSGDGIGLTPRAYAQLLDALCGQAQVEEDNYLLGGAVESFEREWAHVLGKETAVFMPSGTLANHLALRTLAGSKRRVVVPEVSHVYNDTGDACQTLSGLTLVPLAPGAATFTVADVDAVLARTAGGRVATEVGAILVESPIRRLSGQMFDWAEMTRVAAFVRERGIGLHLDGARIFIASAYTGISPAEYAAPFDTVYVSLWKYFNSGIGAILAGPRRVLDGMFHVRRMFGGNLAVGWPAAMVARHFMDGYLDRMRTAIKASEDFYAAIARHPAVAIEPIPNGTNLRRVSLKGIDVAAARRRLASKGIQVPDASRSGTLTLGVNETWNRMPAADLAREFAAAL
jgi:threonine aldolase